MKISLLDNISIPYSSKFCLTCSISPIRMAFPKLMKSNVLFSLLRIFQDVLFLFIKTIRYLFFDPFPISLPNGFWFGMITFVRFVESTLSLKFLVSIDRPTLGSDSFNSRAISVLSWRQKIFEMNVQDSTKTRLFNYLPFWSFFFVN